MTSFKGSKSQAAAKLRDLLIEAGSAPLPDAAPVERTLTDLLAAWVGHLESVGRSPRYVHEARRTIDTRIGPALGAIRLDQLTTKHLDDVYGRWAREGLSGDTIRRYAANVSSALAQGMRWGWNDRNPADLVTLPKGKAARKTLTPSADEIGALIRAAEDKGDTDMAAAIALAFVTGCRRGELAALRWSDVDLDAGTVHVCRSMGRVGAELVEGPTKTGKERTVVLDPKALALLQLHHQRSDADEDGRVIDLTPDKMTDRFRKLVAATPDVRDGIRFHDQRHATATQLLGAGIDAPSVAKRLGHANARTTLTIYAHALPAGEDAAALVMGGLLPEADAS
jgi:integrase